MRWFSKRWWRRFPSRQARVRAVDPADMGTVVGLDASVERLDPTWLTAGPASTAPTPSWEDRLVRRSGL